jgi:hypothetical protein
MYAILVYSNTRFLSSLSLCNIFFLTGNLYRNTAFVIVGLPPSPPLPSGITMIDGGPYAGTNNARTNKPLGVDVQKGQHKNGLSGGIIAIIALSAFVGVFLCSAAAWVLLYKHRNNVCEPVETARALPPSLTKPSGNPIYQY